MENGSLALINGRIRTMDAIRPEAEAALALNGRIVLVGSNDEITAASGGMIQTFDCAGRTVVPGFIDGHAHFEMTCQALTHCLSLTTPPYNTLASIADAIRARADREVRRVAPAG